MQFDGYLNEPELTASLRRGDMVSVGDLGPFRNLDLLMRDARISGRHDVGPPVPVGLEACGLIDAGVVRRHRSL